ncbi:MAG: hypothetical protein ACI8S6_003836 [Myxococcota bacterium]|jgi:hypothetical protein
MRRLLAATLITALACSGFGERDRGTTTTHVAGSGPSPTTMPGERSEGPGCVEPIDTPEPQGCTVGRISCGDEIQASTAGGPLRFGDDFYVYHFCTPQRHDYDDSPEVAYMLTVPGDKKATITVTSDCADLDVSAMSWDEPGSCPRAEGRRLNECEMRPKHDSVSVATVTHPQEYMVVVDGRKGSEGNFTLSVRCDDYR